MVWRRIYLNRRFAPTALASVGLQFALVQTRYRIGSPPKSSYVGRLRTDNVLSFLPVLTTDHQVRRNPWWGVDRLHGFLTFFRSAAGRSRPLLHNIVCMLFERWRTARANLNNTCHNKPTTTGAKRACANCMRCSPSDGWLPTTSPIKKCVSGGQSTAKARR